MTTRNAAITGWGWYTPPRVVTNQDMGQFVETTDAWIRSRTGIRERSIAGPGESTATMSLQAARRALACARLAPSELDLIICASTTPDHLLPATGCLIQHHLGADRAGAFDLNSACSGFVSALAVGTQFIQAGTYQRVLVVAGETLSRFTNWSDRETCVLFGDGAGAVVLEATPQSAGVLSTLMGSKGDHEHTLTIPAGGSALPASAETVAEGAHLVRMSGKRVFREAVQHMALAAREALTRAGLTQDDLHRVIPHQANMRILTATREELGLPAEKMFINIDRTANTGAASVPIALAQMLEERPARVGDNFLMVAFGGGFTWAAAVVRWADVAAIRGTRGLRLSA